MYALYWKGQSQLRSVGVQGTLPMTFYEYVVASANFYCNFCWLASTSARDRERLDRQVRRVSSVLGCSLDSVEDVNNRKKAPKLTGQTPHPAQGSLTALGSLSSHTLSHLSCRKERYSCVSLSTAVRLYTQLSETL